jgi:hypothetical protein
MLVLRPTPVKEGNIMEYEYEAVRLVGEILSIVIPVFPFG